jgi:hypothetical protein
MKRFVLCLLAVGLLAVAASAAASSLVSVGSPPDTTPQNHQNEPAVAVDAAHPNVRAPSRPRWRKESF